VIISDTIAASFAKRAYPGGLTYAGHPLACAAAVACIGIYREEGLIERARALGETILGPELRAMQARHAVIGEVRGLGAFWAIELVRDRDTRQALVPFNASGEANAPTMQFAAECKRLGVWPLVMGNRLHVVPPLNIDEGTLREGLAAIDEALNVVDRYCEG
jgi:taurine--2-oxoglutarate transaminase